MSTAKITVEEILSHFDRLPEMTVIALQVNRMMDNPKTSAKDLARVIVQDPAFTTKVLKLCNSAEYGFSRKIATISEAVSILGYKELKKIVFTILSHGFMNRPVQGYALEKGALWENSVTCATYAQHLAVRLNFKDQELAFIAALLRDIGKIALEGYIAGQSARLEEMARANKCSFAEAEEMLIGASHTEVGSQLAIKWNLPDSLVKAIAYHHQPSAMSADAPPSDLKLVSIVHLADVFTMMSGVGVGIDGLMYPLDPVIFKNLNIRQDTDHLESLYAELLCLQDEINTLSSSLFAAQDR